MFLIEWMFDKMGYTKKVDWTSSSLTWEMVNVDPKESKVTVKRKPAAKKITRKTVRKKA